MAQQRSSVLTRARSTAIYERLASYPDLHRFVKFALVGVVNVVLYFSVFNVFLWLGWAPLAANAIAYVLSSINSFALNKAWAFRDPRRERIVRQYLVFVFFTAIGLGIHSGVFRLLLIPLGGYGALGENVAALGAMPFSVAWNFTAYRLWTFKPSPPTAGT